MMISIVVPAHNESSVIVRSLLSMTVGAAPGELEVVVVCNGCTDNTAALARQLGPPIRVIETDIASKIHALNLGDQVATGFPRIYIDADVVFTADAIRRLANRLRMGDILLAAPTAHVELSGCSRSVKAFYDIRCRLPSAREGIGGSGVYGLSQAGRSRFDRFPKIVADDTYVRIQFRREERETLASIVSTVFAPRTIKDLIAIRTRVSYGNLELARLFPDLWRNRGVSNRKTLARLFGYPLLWSKMLIYFYVNISAVSKAKRILRGTLAWHRDESSRSRR